MDTPNKQSLILLAAAGLLVVSVLVIAVMLLFRPGTDTQTTALLTPTPVPYTRQSDGTFVFTPLQRTQINRTIEKEVTDRKDILDKQTQGSVTKYTVESATPEETDEIWTENGVVVFESINVFNTKATVPPKVNTFANEFGPAEKILNSVSQHGKHTSAYIYAEEGFTLFANRYTNTVYEIQRFTPMSTREYERKFAEYVQKAPDYPRESFTE